MNKKVVKQFYVSSQIQFDAVIQTLLIQNYKFSEHYDKLKFNNYHMLINAYDNKTFEFAHRVDVQQVRTLDEITEVITGVSPLDLIHYDEFMNFYNAAKAYLNDTTCVKDERVAEKIQYSLELLKVSRKAALDYFIVNPPKYYMPESSTSHVTYSMNMHVNKVQTNIK